MPSISDDDLGKIWVGELVPLNNTVNLVDYDPDWPRLYEREAARIRDILGATALRIEHVGSTSVPGLPAKPILDMLLVVPDSADEPAYLPVLGAAGYPLVIREPDWYEHRQLKGPDTNINLHVFSAGSPEIDRMVCFRDWLRATDADRQRYADVKRELAGRVWRHIQHYAEAKSAVVQEIMDRALAARQRQPSTGQ
jgi:GrpB-like predicted nucleotidyltransferase (UPF0157 family)